MARHVKDAIAAANATKKNSPAMCQKVTREWYGAGSVGDVDRDGDTDAVDGWKSEPKWAQHPGDYDPPVGAPLAWSGGSGGFGHRAMYIGNGLVRSTDAGGKGIVANKPIKWFEEEWNLKYLGWSETISGQPIPGLLPTQAGNMKMPKTAADIDHMIVIEQLRAAGFECYTRAQWGTVRPNAYAQRGRTHPMPNGPTDFHALHITVTPDTDTKLEGFAGMRKVESFGLSSGGAQVSYQDCVTNEGKYFQGQDYGTRGTHTINDKKVKGFVEQLNEKCYATAIMQNVNDEVTDAQVELIAAIFAARELAGLTKKGAPVYPHRKFAFKACPGDKAVARIPEIVKLKNHYVKFGLPNKNAAPVKKTMAVLVSEVIAGRWGNGDVRARRLREAGYDPVKVQAAVDKKKAPRKPSKPAKKAATPAKPKLKAISTVAKEVKAGKWGNGAARTSALKKAGYDPKKVQAAVNKL